MRPGWFAGQMLATRATAPILAVLALLLATPVPRQRAPESEPGHVVIDAGPALADVITPGKFRDAQPWPHGMVIRPPATADQIALAMPADTVWSALFDALLAPAATLL